MRDVDEILNLFQDRRRVYEPQFSRMRELRDAYNGDVVVPLPELDANERVAVANLVSMGLDQKAMRVSSTLPDVYFPPAKPGVDMYEKRSRTCRQATLGWWAENNQKLKLRRRARQLLGYSSTAVVIRPHPEWNIPMWQVRDALGCFPPPERDADDFHPTDCLFNFVRTWGWLKANYPANLNILRRPKDTTDDDTFECVEYVDGDEYHLIVVGRAASGDTWNTTGSVPAVALQRVENRTGMCPAVVAGRINLDRPQGAFDGVLGMYESQAKLFALGMIAEQRNIFRDTYLVSRPGETADFIAGPYDGRSGLVNIIKGGDIEETGSDPSPQLGMWIDRLERAQRVTAGIPAELGGEAGSNIRTGRRGEQVLSAVVDFDIQENQEIFAHSLMIENKIAIAVDKAYFDTPKSFYVNWRGAKGQVDYKPSDIFTSDTNVVAFAFAGQDANSMTVRLGQLLGLQIISRDTARSLSPDVENPEHEKDWIAAEMLEQAGFAALQAQAQQGAITLDQIARIASTVRQDKIDMLEAAAKVHEQLQAEQAQPPEAGAPEAQPGLGGPPQEQPTVQPPSPSLQNLNFMLSDLRNRRTA